MTQGYPVRPDATLTPGVTNPNVTQANITQTIGKRGWTATIRPPVSYTDGLKKKMLASGVYASAAGMASFELDHLISLELGGHPTDPKNLWPQSRLTTQGAAAKDALENVMNKLVVSGKLPLTQAQKEISTDWIAAYRKYIGPLAVKRYNWKPDLPDNRDHLFLGGATPLPSMVDLRAQCSPVEDQGQLGSCTGNAWAGMLEFLELKAGTPFQDLSRLFIYYNERVIEGTVKQDAGAQVRDGAKALANTGVCSETLWPYDIARFARKPTKAAFADAATRKISQYMRLNTTDDMQACLAAGFPFVFGFSVYESFESQAVAQTGVVDMPKPGEKLLGGHAVLCVGYDQSTQRFIVRNSWGTGWGQAGVFTIPFDYLANRNLSDDFWTVRK